MLRCDPRIFRALGVPRALDAIACREDVQRGAAELSPDRTRVTSTAGGQCDEPCAWTEAEWALWHENRDRRQLETFYDGDDQCH